MIELHKLDVRTVERHIRKGTITRADYDKSLADLPDLGENVDFVDYATRFKEEDRVAAAEAAEAEDDDESEESESDTDSAPTSGFVS